MPRRGIGNSLLAWRTLGHGSAANSIPGVNRFLSLSVSLGVAPKQEHQNLRPLWRIMRNWEKAVRAEIHRPLRRQAAVAMAVVFVVMGSVR